MWDALEKEFVPVKITAFEYNTDTGNKIYSIEAVDIEKEKSAGQLEDGIENSPRSPIADFTTNIEKLLEQAQGDKKIISKIVDENGEPLVVYHHTENNIDAFDRSKARTSMDVQGFFFYDDPHAGDEYGSRTYPVYLNIRNPFIVNSSETLKKASPDLSKTGDGVRVREELQAEGYDGIIYDKDFMGSSTTEIVAFEPNQIKSAERNNGDFSRSDDRILFSVTAKDDSKYLKAVEDGDMDTAQEMVDRAAEAAGYPIRAFHGTARADRVGTVFRPERATSGPMAFFTDDRALAEGYARGKQDTSVAYDSDYDSYQTQFRTRNPKTGKDYSVYDIWGFLPFPERRKIEDKAKHVRARWEEDGEVIYDPDTTEANGAWSYQVRDNKGNILKALNTQWLESGNLFGREKDYLKVLELAGVNEALEKLGFEPPRYMDPEYREEAVYDVYLGINNPFDVASMVDEDFIAKFEEFAEEHETEYVNENADADAWDKNAITAEEFADNMRWDLENGNSFAWTQIPDVVTAYLKELGFDGIKDQSGKHGGEVHTVWIPFSSEQVKSAETVTYDDNGNVIPLSQRFKKDNDDIRFSLTNRREETFFSNAERSLDAVKQDKGTPDQWLKMIEKAGGLKAGEDKWIGLSDWLKSQDKKSLTKQEIADYIRSNRIQIEEVNYSENGTGGEEFDPSDYELPPKVDDFHSRLQNEFDDLIETMSPEEAYDTMADKYGGLFEDAYDRDEVIDGESLQWTYLDSLMELAGYKNIGTPNGDRAINTTRLTYTTDGLDNKREIALTVPTIGPYNENDDIHFGDAGEGRAIAWARFGETSTKPRGDLFARHIDDELESKYGSSRNYYAMTDEDAARSFFSDYVYRGAKGDYTSYKDLFIGRVFSEIQPERLDKVYSIFEKMAKDIENPGDKVLVIDEIQSNRHQDARKKGYKSPDEASRKEALRKQMIEAQKEANEKSAAHFNFLKFIYGEGYKEGGVPKELADARPLTEEERETESRLANEAYEARQRKRELEREANTFAEENHGKVPAAPFEKNWHELAMKRMLRLAAEEGFDYVAWTTGAQQAERYGLGQLYDEIGSSDWGNDWRGG